MNPNGVPMFQSLLYDNLTPLEKPTPYKEGGKGPAFSTFTGFDDRKKAFSFLLQFDKAYAGRNFTEAFKNFASPWLRNEFEAVVMTEWHQRDVANCKNLDDYNRKFWKALLPVTSYKFVPLTKQIEKYYCGLYKGLTKVTTLTQLIEVANTGNEGAAAQPIPILPPPSLPDPPASPVITPSTSHPVPPIQPPDVSPDHALSDSDSDLDVADATSEVDLAPPRREKRIPGWLYSTVGDVDAAGICKVIPEQFSGSKEVVPLDFKKAFVSDKDMVGQEKLQGMTLKQLAAAAPPAMPMTEEVSFEFRKQRFVFSPELQRFQKLPYPSKDSFGTYCKSTGYGSEAKASAAANKWGRNMFEFPQPTFQKLMKEHCMEPFFVFQVFCVGLWCLDEYWYYSIFTLFMLVLFESTVVKSRIRTLAELRRVRVDSQTLMVHRGGKWVKLSGIDLLPGDVVSIGRPIGSGAEDRTVPADMLLLAGSAITNEALLTGESTPQWKVSIIGRQSGEMLSLKRDKNHVLFGGTKILQHTADKNGHLKTPDGGCLAIVLRTGFETSQGKLMRTILFSTERVTANNWESGLFICFLVIFALVAAGYVLKKGLEDPSRSKYKLFLNCSLIITSVIPPELPMELSIAVNTSLIALARKGIFCTEPFRIPFAGKVDVCCFDKTGTLTSDDMEFHGVVSLNGREELESDPSIISEQAVQVLAACHSLVFVDSKLVGDPLEKAALKGIDWAYTSDEKAIPRKGNYQPVQILRRNHFASHLKRMSTVVRVQDSYFSFVKGAPEVIQERLTEVDPKYVEAYKYYTCQGSRVLALAYKSLPEMPVSELRNLDREFVESGLSFAGFAVFACPLRNDSASVLKELKNSSHDLVS
ncbi:hypothetical protein L7F22_053435 [Adiantum nelumboides]|nr:hypothetical protein [Adiantum nelumboides]